MSGGLKILVSVVRFRPGPPRESNKKPNPHRLGFLLSGALYPTGTPARFFQLQSDDDDFTRSQLFGHRAKVLTIAA